jgi:polar amino acid transport system substrate-binding protein
MQALVSGKIDATVVDRFAAIEMIQANPSAKLAIGESVSNERIAMAVAKGNDSLRDALNQGLAETLKDGTYAKLSQKYFGQDVRCH